MSTPDAHATGLLKAPPDALRYDWETSFTPEDEGEVPGIVRNWMPDHCRLLDVGCSAGSITLKVTGGKQVTVLGVEPDPTRSAGARARGLDVITGLMDAELLRQRGPFDIIMFTDVLEHVDTPSQILEIAALGLGPGGVVIASVPNVAHWTVRLKLLFGRFDYTDSGIMDATHLRWFTQKSYISLFERSGFRVTGLAYSAGTWLGEYRKAPFCWLPAGLRTRIIRALTRAAPRVFGCQIVVRAERA